MSALATVLAGRGWRLTASDGQLHAGLVLPGTGTRIAPGHSPRYLPANTDVVVYSCAVPAENHERRRAARLTIPAISYPRMLGQLMRDRIGLAVAGTHGKSTTAAMAAEILIRGGLDPTVMIGAAPANWHTGGRPGGGKHLLVEACEYRGNFLHLAPQAAVLLNLEPDHFDYFRSTEHLESTFAEFVRRVPDGGMILTRSGCSRLAEVCKEASAKVITFGTAPNDHWRAVGIEHRDGFYRFEVWRGGKRLAGIRLSVPGRHQVNNALAAVALAGELGVAADILQVALEEFRGVKRRAELVGTFGGISLVDDYAHHPTAVAATLEMVREVFSGRRIWCVFEPHQASRLEKLLDEFARSLHNADNILVTEIYRAREAAGAATVSAMDLVERIRGQGGQARAARTFEELLGMLEAEVRPGDVIVTVGAGEVGKIRHALVERLRGNHSS